MKAIGSRVTRMSFVGCFAALASAVPLGLVLTTIKSAVPASIMFGLLLGSFLAAFLMIFDHLWHGKSGGMVTKVLISSTVGAAGGIAGALVGQGLFHTWGNRLVGSSTSGISVPLSLGAALGWGLTGLAVGLAVTLPFAENRGRWFAASAGGFTGGFVGGLVMQSFRPLMGVTSMTLGLAVLGWIMGFGISWAQQALGRLRLQVLEGPGRGSEFALGQSAVLGSDRQCAVRLTGAGIASKHARIECRDGRPYLEDLGSSQGIIVNDRKMSRHARPLRHGDLIRMGDNLLRVNASGPSVKKKAVTVMVLLTLLSPLPVQADPEAQPEWQITQIDTSRYPIVDLYATLPAQARPGRIRDLSLLEGDVETTILEVRDLSRGVRDVPLTVSLVVDVSESMQGPKLEEAKRALVSFSRSIPTSANIHLVVFSDTVRVLARDLTPDRLPEHAGRLVAEGHTALFDAVSMGTELVRGRSGRRVVLTLTDGMANRGTVSMEQTMSDAERAGVSLMFVGLGPDARKNRLTSMARETGGRAVYTSKPEVLAGLFEGVASQISSEVLFRYRAMASDSQVVPVTLQLNAAGSDIQVSDRYFSPRATFMGTTGKVSWPLILVGLLGPIGLLLASRLTAFEIVRSDVLLVEGSAGATRMLTRVLTRHGMTIPMSIGGETLLVNNQPVTGSRTLKPGDTLTWGETTIMHRGK
ncbi:MAG: VWA domain-containing protein [bacterium]|nr:MAG: VWA domain-containing protein [bacterium]